MAERKAPATKTSLAFGLVEVPIGLVKTTFEPAESQYDVAGPSGHALIHATRYFDAEDNLVDAPDEPEKPADRGEELRQIAETATALADADPGPESRPDPLDAQRAFADAAGIDLGPTPKQVLVEEETGEYVPADAVRRGIRRPDGEFIDLTEGLADIDDATAMDQMEVIDFIDVGVAERYRIKGSYYVSTEGQRTTKALELLKRVMKRKRRVAVVQWTKRKGQSLGILTPHKSGALVVLDLAYANHVRQPDERCIFEVDVSDEAVAAAEALVDAMAVRGKGQLDELRDARETMRAELLALAEEGKAEEFGVPEKVVAEDPGEDVEELALRSADRADEIAAAA